MVITKAELLTTSAKIILVENSGGVTATSQHISETLQPLLELCLFLQHHTQTHTLTFPHAHNLDRVTHLFPEGIKNPT